MNYSSWGGVKTKPGKVLRPAAGAGLHLGETSYLPYGAGRSYGDTCLPPGTTLVHTSALNSVIAFDATNGVLRAGAGMKLRDILDHILPHGWFLPVTPGTAEVTLGGALANDVHGKNHHVAGSFGCFVRAFELVRSDRMPMICSAEDNADYFAATIGGMGLTGLVTWVEIDLVHVRSGKIRQKITRFANIDECFALGPAFEAATYSVAWLDGLAPAKELGRGLLIDGEHADDGDFPMVKRASIDLPFTPPLNLVWRTPVKLMNALYMRQREGESLVETDKFFYPLDRIGHWSRLYGPRGFHQFQCVIPADTAPAAIRRLLEVSLADAGGSNLVVLKKFGERRSPGLLSFPMPGYTLTMDFPHRGEVTLKLIDRLNIISLEASGRVNPYKARAMSADVFRASFPHWRDALPLLDPQAESQFSRRVGLGAGTAHTPKNSLPLASSSL
jgi:FAD/FMN-containing dehydrogenase